MRKIDKILGIALMIVSILSCVANYFNVLATPLIVAGAIVGIFAMTLAMMETYHHQSYYNENSSWFWLVYSATLGAILVGNFYSTGIGLINERLGLSLLGLSYGILPVLGVFFGNIGRILFKGEPSVI